MTGLVEHRLKRIRPIRFRIACIALMLCPSVFACSDPQDDLAQRYAIDRPAAEYIDSAVSLINDHSLYGNEIDIDSFRTELYSRCEGSRTPEDVHIRLDVALASLGDGHTSFVYPDAVSFYAEQDRIVSSGDMVDSSALPFWYPLTRPCGLTDIGVLYLPTTAHPSVRLRDYADRAMSAVQEAYDHGVRRYIVDLRKNVGGNIGPMFRGLCDLVGRKKFMEFVDREERRQEVLCRDGVLSINRVDVFSVTQYKPVPAAATLPVIVLLSSNTASAGEAVAIAFRNRPRVIYVGERSAGLTTGTASFGLPDGAALNIAGVHMTDGMGSIVLGSLRPDIEISWQNDSGLTGQEISIICQLFDNNDSRI